MIIEDNETYGRSEEDDDELRKSFMIEGDDVDSDDDYEDGDAEEEIYFEEDVADDMYGDGSDNE